MSIVDTGNGNGRVRGAVHDGVQVFRGLRYGDTTAGANRFLPPQPVRKWAGIQDAPSWGASAPQQPQTQEPFYKHIRCLWGQDGHISNGQTVVGPHVEQCPVHDRRLVQRYRMSRLRKADRHILKRRLMLGPSSKGRRILMSGTAMLIYYLII